MRCQWLSIAVICLVMSGCASTPSVEIIQEEAAAEDQNGYAIHEDVLLSPDLKQDFERAVKFLQDGEYEKGIELLTRLTQHPLASNNTAPYIDLAIAYHRLGKLEQAEENLEKALSINPEHPVANNEYGLVMRKTGRFAEARAAYEAVLDRYPEFLPARLNLGVLCDLYLGDYECALENYRIYSAVKSDDKSVAIWIADVENRLAQQGANR
jgi:tetratricopeptide (TPR) repeat protein